MAALFHRLTTMYPSDITKLAGSAYMAHIRTSGTSIATANNNATAPTIQAIVPPTGIAVLCGPQLLGES